MTSEILYVTQSEVITQQVPDHHKKGELGPFVIALHHSVGRDVEGREVGFRGNVVMHGDLWRDRSSQIKKS